MTGGTVAVLIILILVSGIAGVITLIMMIRRDRLLHSAQDDVRRIEATREEQSAAVDSRLQSLENRLDEVIRLLKSVDGP